MTLKKRIGLLASTPLIFFLATTATAANLISDAGFTAFADGSGQIIQNSWGPGDIGNWAVGDSFTIREVFTSNAPFPFTPEGDSKVMQLSVSGSLADVYQIVDLNAYAGAIDAGQATIDFSAYFNTKTFLAEVGLNVLGWTAAPSSFSGFTFSSGNFTNALTTDGDASTWEQVSDSAILPSGIRYVALGLHSNSNAAFVGSPSLTVSTVPIPAAAWLFGSALLGLGVLKRRKV